VTNDNRPSAKPGSATLLTLVVAVVVLYFARMVLIPLALAILLTFLLAPLVIRLRHWGLGRVPAAIIVVMFWFVIIAVVGSVMTTQLTDLAQKLPKYQQNMTVKLNSIRSSGGGMLTRITRMVQDLSQEVMPRPPAPRKPAPGEEKPVPVEIRQPTFSPLQMAGTVVGSVVNGVLMAAIVIVFVIFMLIQREDLRDRLIRVIGGSQLHVTTQALDDAGHRLSRFLLAQLTINVLFGFIAGLGLSFLKVPNPLLWGVVAALLRYVPYLGLWIAAAMPALIMFAVEPGWMKPIAIFVLYIGVDVLIINFLEPLLYGSSTGISPIAILVTAVFWTWLWGPVGLLLATPLTVCLVVVGRYVPNLEFLSVILSDEPVLPPATRFYQRMLAMDVHEATEVAEDFLKGKSLQQLYDELLIPALTLAEEDRHNGKLDEAREEFLIQNTRVLLDYFAEAGDKIVASGNGGGKRKRAKPAVEARPSQGEEQPTVIAIPARDEADELAAVMLEQLLRKQGITTITVSAGALAAECLEEVGRHKFRVACVLAVPPSGYIHARYLCKRLQAEFPDLKLVAAILNEGDVQLLRNRQPGIPADEFATSLKQTVAEIVSLAATQPDPDAPKHNGPEYANQVRESGKAQ
jgi:predicted PurR-regulated permease PerM